IQMIALHRANRSKPPTQDRRRLTRYMRRRLVERFFAWNPMAAPHSRPLAIPHPELPWFRPAPLPCSPLHALLTYVLVISSLPVCMADQFAGCVGVGTCKEYVGLKQ